MESMQASVTSRGGEEFLGFIYSSEISIKIAPPLLSMHTLRKLTVMGALLTSVVHSRCPLGFRKESLLHFMGLRRMAITF